MSILSSESSIFLGGTSFSSKQFIAFSFDLHCGVYCIFILCFTLKTGIMVVLYTWWPGKWLISKTATFILNQEMAFILFSLFFGADILFLLLSILSFFTFLVSGLIAISWNKKHIYSTTTTISTSHFALGFDRQGQ